jgi:hypothetical protein
MLKNRTSLVGLGCWPATGSTGPTLALLPWHCCRGLAHWVSCFGPRTFKGFKKLLKKEETLNYFKSIFWWLAMGNEFCMESRGVDTERRQRYPVHPAQARIHRPQAIIPEYPENSFVHSQHYLKQGEPELRISVSSRTSSEKPAVRFSPNHLSENCNKSPVGSFVQSRRGILKNDSREETVSYTNAIRV